MIDKPKEKIIEKKLLKKVEKNITIKEKQKLGKPIEKIKKVENFEKVEDLKKYSKKCIEKKNNLNFNQRVLQNNNSEKLLADQKIKSFLIK